MCYNIYIKGKREVNKMFKLYDYYEGGKDLVATAETWQEIKKLKKEYIADTDGECDLEIEQDGEVC